MLQTPLQYSSQSLLAHFHNRIHILDLSDWAPHFEYRNSSELPTVSTSVQPVHSWLCLSSARHGNGCKICPWYHHKVDAATRWSVVCPHTWLVYFLSDSLFQKRKVISYWRLFLVLWSLLKQIWAYPLLTTGCHSRDRMIATSARTAEGSTCEVYYSLIRELAVLSTLRFPAPTKWKRRVFVCTYSYRLIRTYL